MFLGAASAASRLTGVTLQTIGRKTIIALEDIGSGEDSSGNTTLYFLESETPKLKEPEEQTHESY